MYQEFFSLKVKPFSISPDPNFLFLSGRHKEAIAHLKQGLRGNTRFALLTGEVGTGKTTICRTLIESMPGNYDIAALLNPTLSDVELLSSICDSFNIAHTDNHLENLFALLEAWLVSNCEQQRRSIVIVDEAQHLSFAALEQLRLLSNINSGDNTPLQVILIGQTELQDKLKQAQFSQLAQSISTRYHLLSLTQQESNLYIQHRLKIAGSEHAIFDKSALQAIFKQCSGTPRLTNILCDRSLLAAYAQGSHLVTLAMVKQASSELHFSDTQATDSLLSKHWRVLTLAILAIITAWQTPQLVERIIAPVINEQVALPAPTPPHPAPLVVPPKAVPLTTPWFDEHPELDLTHTGYEDALSNLFAVWGYRVENHDVDCMADNGAHIYCDSSSTELEQLLTLDYPAVVGLQNYDGDFIYAVLYKISGGYQLLIGEQLVSVSKQWFINHWDNDSTLLWQAPFALTGVIKRGQRGPQVTWLANKLSALQGVSQGKKVEFDQQLKEQVIDFQRQQGLTPDGIVGTRTLITLTRLTSLYSPRLFQEQ